MINSQIKKEDLVSFYYSKRRYILLTLSKISVSVLLAFYVVFVNTANAQNKLEIKMEVINERYCLGDSLGLIQDPETEKFIQVPSIFKVLDIKFKVTLTNISSKPLIVQKDFFAVPQRIIARNLSLYNKGKFIRNSHFYIQPQFDTLSADSPPENKFVILKPGEVFSTEIEDSIDLDGASPKIKNGNYYMGIVVYIWGGQSWTGEELRKKWKKFGYLWLNPIITEPVRLPINIPATITKCL